MRKLLLIILLNTYLFSNYIESAIVVCQSIEEIQVVEPHIDKDSNKFIIPKNCLILTHNADIEILEIIDNLYVKILITDLNLEMYTLKTSIKRY